MNKELIIILLWILFILIALIRVFFFRPKSLVLGKLFVPIFQMNSGPNPCKYSSDTIDTIEITDLDNNLYTSKWGI